MSGFSLSIQRHFVTIALDIAAPNIKLSSKHLPLGNEHCHASRDSLIPRCFSIRDFQMKCNSRSINEKRDHGCDPKHRAGRISFRSSASCRLPSGRLFSLAAHIVCAFRACTARVRKASNPSKFFGKQKGTGPSDQSLFVFHRAGRI